MGRSSRRHSAEAQYWQSADGTGSAERLANAQASQIPGSFSPDGTRLAFAENLTVGMKMLLLDGMHRTENLIQTQFVHANAEISPDGHWIAYQSNESNGTEIYVRPFPKANDGRWQISTGEGGTRPMWARNGREVYSLNGSGRLMAVSVQTGSTFTAGNPTIIIDRPYHRVPRTMSPWAASAF